VGTLGFMGGEGMDMMRGLASLLSSQRSVLCVRRKKGMGSAFNLSPERMHYVDSREKPVSYLQRY
jgi:hypothetical protein